MLVSALLKHSKAILKDLEDAKADGSWVVIPAHEPLRYAGFVALQEVNEAMHAHFMNPDSQKLQEGIIWALLNFNTRWDSWIETVEFESSASKLFHSILLRFSKGIARHYRIWLIDSPK